MKLSCKVCSIIAASVSFLMLAGCQSSETISQKNILKQFNKELVEQAKDQIVTSFQVGTFECNDADQREFYRKLQAAGLITYKVDRYAWWEKSLRTIREPYTVTRYYGWYTWNETEYRTITKNVYNFEDHYIVSISLTKNGQKYVLDSLPQPKENIDKDMIQPEVDPSKYAWNKADLTEEWPDIENPFIKKVEQPAVEEAAPIVDSLATADTVAYTPVSVPEASAVSDEPKDKTERIEKSKYEAYKAFSPDTQTVYLKLGKVVAFKARNIQISNVDGIATAKAEVLTKIKDVTDFARIFYGMEEGTKQEQDVSLSYFLDKGWVMNKEDSDVEDFDY